MDRRVWHPSSRTLAGALALVAVAALWGATTPVSVRAAQSDLTYISNSTWTADPTAARVHVLAAVTATSHAVDGDARSYYYDRIQLTLPPDSAEFGATSEGRDLPLTVESVTQAGVNVVVGLGQRLYSGQSGSFDLTFDLVDTGGSTDRDLRIGHNLMSFPVSAFGSPNTPGSSVTVMFPADFAVQQEFGGLTRTVYGSGEVVFSSGVIDDPTSLSAWFTAVQPVPAGGYKIRTVTIGPLNVALRYWSDDAGWADQVERVLRAGYPVLRDMIGLGDPNTRSILVEEASTQEIGSFSGSYDQGTGQILISYFADPFVILHEAAHMWFNGTLVSDRWVEEGFASYYAQQAVDRLGFTDHAPVLTDRMRGVAVPLNDWATAGEPNSATDAYLYGATLEVARQIASRAGQDGLRSVWAAARSGSASYQPLHAAQPEVLVRKAADWRRLLDLLEQTTGLSYTGIWKQWVVDPAHASLLDQRASALSSYADAKQTAGTWDLPAEIRRSLDAWQYDRAAMYIVQAHDILSRRDQIATAAAIEHTTPPPALQAAFEHSGVIAASAEAASESAVLNELSAARQAQTDSGGAARELGLLGANPQADLASARDAFAKGDLGRAMSLASSARTAWQSATGTGQTRIFGSLCILAGGLLLFVLYAGNRGAGRRRSLAVAGATGAGVEANLALDAAAGARAISAGDAAAGVEAVPVGRLRVQAPVSVAIGSKGASAGRGSDELPSNGHERLPGAGAGAGAADGLDEAASDGESRDDDDFATIDDGSAGSAESAYELLQRGHALLRDRHNAQAAVVLERAARLERSKGSILEALGRAYYNSGQHARAAETFEAMLKVDPSAHYGHFGLGLSCARLGRPRQAKTHLRLAAALDPTSATYRRALEKIEATKS